MTQTADPTVTYRTFLVIQTMERTGCSWMEASEAVSSTAIEHPEWPMDECRTLREWLKPKVRKA